MMTMRSWFRSPVASLGCTGLVVLSGLMGCGGGDEDVDGSPAAGATGSAGAPSAGATGTGTGGSAGAGTSVGGALGQSGSVGSGGTTAGMGGAPSFAGATSGAAGATPTAGTTASGGAGPTGGTGNAGASGKAGSNAGGSAGASGAAGASGRGGGSNDALAKFSFFVTSYPAMKMLSGKAEGFGGDLRFGKADGLSGADEICRQVAELGMPGAGQKQWRAFLSVTKGPEGVAINARDRIGNGPWYDAKGRLLANTLDDLFAQRPPGDSAIVNDLPNERGEPNHYVGPNGLQTTTVDNHDTLTGSDTNGRLKSTNAADTCSDWTSTSGGRPWIGHSWPRSANSGRHWISDHQVPGCAPGVDRTLGGSGSGNCIGCSGGYGGFYCFALP